MKKFLLLSFFIAAYHYSAICQDRNLNKFNNSMIDEFLYKNLKYPKSLLSKKIMPSVLLRIKINHDAKIDSINLSSSNPTEVNKEINRVLAILSGKLELTPFKGRTINIPIFFYLYNDEKIAGYDYQKILEGQMEVISNCRKFKEPSDIVFLPVIVKAVIGFQRRE